MPVVALVYLAHHKHYYSSYCKVRGKPLRSRIWGWKDMARKKACACNGRKISVSGYSWLPGVLGRKFYVCNVS